MTSGGRGVVPRADASENCPEMSRLCSAAVATMASLWQLSPSGQSPLGPTCRRRIMMSGRLSLESTICRSCSRIRHRCHPNGRAHDARDLVQIRNRRRVRLRHRECPSPKTDRPRRRPPRRPNPHPRRQNPPRNRMTGVKDCYSPSGPEAAFPRLHLFHA